MIKYIFYYWFILSFNFDRIILPLALYYFTNTLHEIKIWSLRREDKNSLYNGILCVIGIFREVFIHTGQLLYINSSYAVWMLQDHKNVSEKWKMLQKKPKI